MRGVYNKIKCYCVICGNYIGEYNPSQTRKTCSEECYKKLVSKQVSGKNNPNYRHGRHIENRCKKCNKLIDYRATHCHKCRPDRGKYLKKLGYVISEETKKLIGKKSKAKFTEEYKENIRAKHRGKRRESQYGYIEIKNYEHPNINSHNWIFEHILVMSNHLGRPLVKGEIVHHIDGDRKNNDITNLHLCNSMSQHHKIHGTFGNLLTSLMRRGIVEFNKDTEEYEIKEGVIEK